jgi:Ca2+-binding RTX toxin-like protein
VAKIAAADLIYFTSDAIAALTPSAAAAMDLSSFTATTAGYITAAQAPALTSKQIASLDGAQETAGLIADVVAALTPAAFKGLTAGDGIPSLTSDAIAVITPAQLGVLSSAQLEAFTAIQAQYFNDASIAYLKDKGYTVIQSATSTGNGIETTTTIDNSSSAATQATIFLAGRKAVNITGVALKDDTIIGSALNDTISGDSGNDSIDAGAGNDTLTYTNIGDIIDGGDGKDTLKITNIASGYASTSDADDNLVNVENIIVADDNEAAYDFSKQTDGFNITITATGDATVTGSQGDDSITGSAESDVILGDAGNDTITGAGGTDVITGGAGDDVFVIDAGSAVIDEITDFGNGADSFKGVYTSSGNVLKVGIYASSTTELDLSATMGAGASASVTGGAADDVIIGGKSLDTIIGAAGADNIMGGASADTIYANTGKDTVTGGLGADVIKLNAGIVTSNTSADTEADVVIVSAGDSTAAVAGTGTSGTVSGFDTVEYFDLAGVDLLDLDSPSIAAATSATNGTDSSLYLASTTPIASHAIANGIITFDDAGTFNSALVLGDDGDIAAAIQYLTLNDIGDAGTTVAFTVDADGDATAETTYVYQQTGSGTGAHVLVELTGVVATSLISAGTTTDGVLIG